MSAARLVDRDLLARAPESGLPPSEMPRTHREHDSRNESCHCGSAMCVVCHGVCRGLTTQLTDGGPRDAWIATGSRWPGSLQRMVRRCG